VCIVPLLAARDLQPLAVDVSCEVLSDTDKPSPDSLAAQLGMDHQRRDASQAAYRVKERDRVEAEKSGKSFSVAENGIRAIPRPRRDSPGSRGSPRASLR